MAAMGTHDFSAISLRRRFLELQNWKINPSLKGKQYLLSAKVVRISSRIFIGIPQSKVADISCRPILLFRETNIAQEDYKLSHLAYAINFEFRKLSARKFSRRIYLKIPDQPRFRCWELFGADRTERLLLSPDVNDPAIERSPSSSLQRRIGDQVNGLLDGGVDIILVEDYFWYLQWAKASALCYSRSIMRKREFHLIQEKVESHMISGYDYRCFWKNLIGDRTTEGFWFRVAMFLYLSVGLNCAFGAKGARNLIESISPAGHRFFVSAYRMQGLPNEFDNTIKGPNGKWLTKFRDFLQRRMLKMTF